jgi:hypothetical protein
MYLWLKCKFMKIVIETGLITHLLVRVPQQANNQAA